MSALQEPKVCCWPVPAEDAIHSTSPVASERTLRRCSPGRHRRSRLVGHLERWHTPLFLDPCRLDSLQSEMPSPAEWPRRAVANRHIADGEFDSWFGRTTCLSQRTSIDRGKVRLIVYFFAGANGSFWPAPVDFTRGWTGSAGCCTKCDPDKSIGEHEGRRYRQTVALYRKTSAVTL